MKKRLNLFNSTTNTIINKQIYRNVTFSLTKEKLPSKNSISRWNPNAQKDFFAHLTKILNIEKTEGWYNITTNDIRRLGGVGLLKMYQGSLIKLIRNQFPEYDWKIYKFQRLSQGHWNSQINQREAFDQLARLFEIKKREDWYQITSTKIREAGAGGLMAHFKNSMFTGLTSAYPEYEWKGDRFQMAPLRFWHSHLNQREFMDNLAKKLLVQEFEDWYQVTIDQILLNGGRGLLDNYKSHTEAIQAIYPEYKFDTLKWKLSKIAKTSKPEQLLFLHIREIFPNFIVYNKHIHPSLIFSETKLHMELDIFIPNCSLAFEYQGKGHYKSDGKPIAGNFQRTVDFRDQEKREACKREFITLIEIPYWWDGSREAILATIHKYRPELVSPPIDVDIQPIGVVRSI